MQHKNTVCCIIGHDDKILLLKRGLTAPWYADKWAFVCGLMEEGESPKGTAYREIQEETGLKKDDLELVKQRELIVDEDSEIDITWHIIPFLFEAKTTKVTLDHESSDYVWVKIDELLNYSLAHGMVQSSIKLLGELPERKGVFVIVYRNPDSFLVVTTKNDNLNFVAGGVDAGETDEEAIIREVREESGIEVKKNQLKKLPFVNKFTYKKGFFGGVTSKQTGFLVKVKEDSDIRPMDNKEITDARWMTKDEVRKNLTFNRMKEIFEKSLAYL